MVALVPWVQRLNVRDRSVNAGDQSGNAWFQAGNAWIRLPISRA